MLRKRGRQKGKIRGGKRGKTLRSSLSAIIQFGLYSLECLFIWDTKYGTLMSDDLNQ